MKTNVKFDFLKSALDKRNIDYIFDWILKKNNDIQVKISKVPFLELENWSINKKDGSLKHSSGKFFSIDGIRINTTWGEIKTWEQPIINQPEIGFLGFIVKKIDGVFHFLVQAKIEPGNINKVQLSPTLQATRSNYIQVHGGKKPLYLEYFQNASKENILLDQLQSEQGARFLKKRNRNIIILVNKEIPVYDDFTWATLGQLKELMKENNLVNMDTRTVLSGIVYGDFSIETIDFFNYLNKSSNHQGKFLKSMLIKENALNTQEEIINFITQIKSIHDLFITKIPLSKIIDWDIKKDEISRDDKCFFKVIGVKVEIENREVQKWYQPMVEPSQTGLCAFVCKEINGILHFAVQAKLECGNHDIIEFAPTVQTLTGDYKKVSQKSLPFLDYVLNVNREKIYYDTMQSEEGGRFFKEENRNMIIIAGDEISEELPENFIWLTLNQISIFIRFNNYVNIQARNLIAAISFN